MGEGKKPSPTEWGENGGRMGGEWGENGEQNGYELQERKARLRKDRKRERNVKRYKFDSEGHEKMK